MNYIERAFLDILSGSQGILPRLKSADWNESALLSERNGLFAIFYVQLLRLKPDNLPSGLLSRLKEKYLLNLKRNKLLERELFRVVSYFEARGIEAIPLKGPVLAEYLYKDVGLRQASCDLDILVKQEQLGAAEKLLYECGYAGCIQDHDGPLSDYNLKYAKQLSYRRQSDSAEFYLIELHTDIRGEFIAAPLKYFWESLREVTSGENKIIFPCDESLLIYLCLNAMTITEFTELRYLYDIHTLVSNRSIDWYYLKKHLANARYKDAVFFALRMSKNLFASAVPGDILNMVRPNLAKRVLLSFWINGNNILRKKGRPGCRWYYFFTAWHYFASSYLYANSIFDCIRIIRKKIFLPANEMQVLYKSGPKEQKHYLSLYIKRLLKPLLYLINAKSRP